MKQINEDIWNEEKWYESFIIMIVVKLIIPML